MRQRTLGDDFTTAPLGLGCMGFSQGYGATDDDDSIAAIRRALDLGVTMLDTAMSYGQGHNERLVARALNGYGGRDDVLVASKFGIVRTDAGVGLDARPEHVRGYCEASLNRLGRDVIDLYYLHRVDPQVPIADTVGAMAELVQDGSVRHIGLSEVTPAQLDEAAAVHPIAAVQFEWSLLWREPERDIIPAARQAGAGIVPYSPLGRGLLTATLDADSVGTSQFRSNDPRFREQNLARNLAQVAALGAMADHLGSTPGQLALAWLLHQGEDVVPIPGSRRIERIEENIGASGVVLSRSELAALDAMEWAGDRQSFAVPGTTRSPG